MKTATIRDLRNHFAKLSAWLADGEEVEITKRGRAFARLLPAAVKKPKPFKLPDFKSRRRKIFGDRTLPRKHSGRGTRGVRVVAFADTGFLASLYLDEETSEAADAALGAARQPVPLTPLVLLELRNAVNRSVFRKRITEAERDAIWQDIEADIGSGFLVPSLLSSAELHAKARILSDRYTPSTGSRTLDLLHVAAAQILGTRVFFSFDQRQRKVAEAEGLEVKP